MFWLLEPVVIVTYLYFVSSNIMLRKIVDCAESEYYFPIMWLILVLSYRNFVEAFLFNNAVRYITRNCDYFRMLLPTQNRNSRNQSYSAVQKFQLLTHIKVLINNIISN